MQENLLPYFPTSQAFLSVLWKFPQSQPHTFLWRPFLFSLQSSIRSYICVCGKQFKCISSHVRFFLTEKKGRKIQAIFQIVHEIFRKFYLVPISLNRVILIGNLVSCLGPQGCSADNPTFTQYLIEESQYGVWPKPCISLFGSNSLILHLSGLSFVGPVFCSQGQCLPGQCNRAMNLSIKTNVTLIANTHLKDDPLLDTSITASARSKAPKPPLAQLLQITDAEAPALNAASRTSLHSVSESVLE